jgi:hypothetical protein
MKLINLTPHSIFCASASQYINLEKQGSIYIADSVMPQQLFIILSSGEARVSISTVEIAPLSEADGFDPIAMYQTQYGKITGLPDSVDPTDLLIVSVMLQSAAKASNHPLLAQMITVYGAVRDRANTSNVLGCQGFTY